MEPKEDPYHGVGGAYVIDKATGKRVPEKAVPPPAAPDEPPAEADTDPQE